MTLISSRLVVSVPLVFEDSTLLEIRSSVAVCRPNVTENLQLGVGQIYHFVQIYEGNDLCSVEISLSTVNLVDMFLKKCSSELAQNQKMSN